MPGLFVYAKQHSGLLVQCTVCVLLGDAHERGACRRGLWRVKECVEDGK